MFLSLLNDIKTMKECKNWNCGSVLATTAVILSAVTLIWGAVLWTTIYSKVDTMHKMVVDAQFGSQETFENYFEAQMTPEYKAEVEKTWAERIDQLKNASWNVAATDTDEPQSEETTGTQEQVLTPEEVTAFLGTTPTMAGKNTDVVVVEYADFLCGYCKQLHEEQTLEKISQENENVAVMIKPIPLFGEQSEAGAQGAYCAAQVGDATKYYEYIEKAFTAQITAKDAALSLAKEIGLDAASFETCLNDNITKATVGNVFPEASSKFGVSGTPASVVINTKTGKYEIVGGAAPKSMFEDAISKVQ